MALIGSRRLPSLFSVVRPKSGQLSVGRLWLDERSACRVTPNTRLSVNGCFWDAGSMTADELTSLPPEESWLPGHLHGPVVLHESESLHVLVEDAEVYPVGILVHVTARFRSLPTLQAQREVRDQVSAFHYDPAGHRGPHLRYHARDEQHRTQPPDPELADAFPWAHRSGGRLCRLGFWIPCEVTNAAPLDYELDWPAQQLRSPFHVSQDQIDQARRAARQLWPVDDPPDDMCIAAI